MSDPQGWQTALDRIQQEKEAQTGSLNLSGLRLTELPDELWELNHLSTLGLHFNLLMTLPDVLGKLTNLLELNLGSNLLLTLPEGLGYLTNLSSLNLSFNQLTTLPDGLGNLSYLTQLYLSNNQLTSLPHSLGNLAHLNILDINHNQLTCLPDGLGNLSCLTSLYLGGNQLTCLPDGLGNLSRLSLLSLSGNQLSSLPDGLGNLTTLSKLYLHNNQLITLPDGLGNLTNLSYLSLSLNQLTSLPDGLSHLTNLSTLDLSGNQLTSLPDWLSNLPYLSSLAFINLGLTFLPDWLGNLPYLSSLYLGGNQLTFLPEGLGNLSRLSTLALSNNQISRLPGWLKNLPLEILNLEGNPLPLAPELLRETNPQILLDTYFGACKPLHEAKLLVVGEGEVGKTSLIRRVMDGEFSDQQSKTDGIQVHRWSVPVDDHQIQVNMWDFGGQEIYQSTHQFFFTKRSVYVVVVSGRQDDTRTLEKWLKTVQQLAGEDAPIVVVVNKIDEHYQPLDERGLKNKYRQIVEIVYLSCRDNYMMVKGEKQAGFTHLTTLLQQIIAHLPHVNDLLHEAWWEVKHSLQNTSYEVMNYDDFVKICEEKRVTTDEAQKVLAQLLHDLGAIVHFQDNQLLENLGVLNPEWVTKGVYAILNSDLIKNKNGQLQLNDLKDILDKTSYPARRHPFLIELMKKFQLCLPITTRENSYLIPALLPAGEPPFEWPFHNSLALEYQYEDFLPDTILLWLMAQSYERLDIGRTWRTGFVLQDKEDGQEINSALIKGDEADRKLYIWVTGRESTRRTLLAVVRDRLVDIHGRFQKLLFQEMCPAVDTAGKIVGLVAYKHLLKLEERQRPTHFDPALDTEIDVKASLNLVDDPEQHQQYIALREKLYTLSPSELNEVIFDLDIPKAHLSQMNQAQLAMDVLDYIKARRLLKQLKQVVEGKFRHERPLAVFTWPRRREG